MLYDDESAWHAWPGYRHWFNKLWLSDQLGYTCGPGCVDVPKPDHYMVRPVINLYGLGAGAEIKYLKDGYGVPPGYFWCEVFWGEHITIDLEWQGGWKPVRTMLGIKHSETKFAKWQRVERDVELPQLLDELAPVGKINIEMIGGNLIEVHLRWNPDPDHDEIIPVHRGDSLTAPSEEYKWIDDEDDAASFAPNHRLGFWYK